MSGDPACTATHAIKLIITNAPAASAPAIARALVRARHAACVNMFPRIQSVYTWEGEVMEEEEVCLWIKTTLTAEPACLQALLELHPYDTPEVLVIAPEKVHARYASWAEQVTSLPTPDDELA